MSKHSCSLSPVGRRETAKGFRRGEREGAKGRKRESERINSEVRRQEEAEEEGAGEG
jgi:hypothetical protein